MIEYRIGDVRDRLAEIPDGSIDLVVTSPPFLALRSYLPDDHPDKHREIGAEPTPAGFINTLLGLSAEFARILTPHGSICVELGDTYSGNTADGWPLNKSLTGIPTLYTWSLAYGRNLLTGQPSPAGQWRIRNLIVWARPNPPVAALGDKFRPATSYITVACLGPKRYFDLDAVRTEHKRPEEQWAGQVHHDRATGRYGGTGAQNPAGAPPLDWQDDMPDEDGDWLWKLTTQPYAGSHYATFPLTLPKRMIEAMCPLRVCVECGKPSERITERTPEYAAIRLQVGDFNKRQKGFNDRATGNNGNSRAADLGKITSAQNTTIGWTDCGHDTWRTGIVFDPFAGSGTTLDAAQAVGRHAIGIDIDERNAELAQERVGMFLTVQR